MTPEVWGIIIVAVLAPSIATLLGAWLARVGRREDYARQDQVAARVEAVAVQAAAAAVLLLDEQSGLKGQLDVIHTLVNSSMTAAMKSEFDAIKRERALMQEVLNMRRAGGHEPSEDAINAIVLTDGRIVELKGQLEERDRQDKIAQSQLVRIVAVEK